MAEAPDSQVHKNTPLPPTSIPTTQVVKNQVAPTPQSPEIPSSGAGRKQRKKILGIVGGLIFLISVIGIAVFFLLKRSNYPVYEVYEPQTIPVGFSQVEGVQTEINQRGNRVFIYEYNHPSSGSIIFSQEENGVLECQPPPTDSQLLTDYISFIPQSSQSGCALTISKATGEKMRSYMWLVDDTKFIILVYDFSIDDAHALYFANSLKQEKVEVGEIIE